MGKGKETTSIVSADEIISKALENSRTRTEPTYVTAKEMGRTVDIDHMPYSFYMNGTRLTRTMKYVSELLERQAKKGIYDKDLINDYQNTLEQYRKMNNEERFNTRYGKDAYASANFELNCIRTALDNYGIKVYGNQTFAANPSKYGFKPIDVKDIQPGDFVQNTEAGSPNHGMIFDGYDENGQMLFNYSTGTDKYITKGHYPFNETPKVYRYVGQDNTEGMAKGGRKYANEPTFKLSTYGFVPNIVKGGTQTPEGDGIFRMRANKKGTDNILIGKDLAVDNNERMRENNGYVEVISDDLKLDNGKSPVGIYEGLVKGGIRPAIAFNNAFRLQEQYKNDNNMNNNTTRAWKGIRQFISDLFGFGKKDDNETVTAEQELTPEEKRAIDRENMASRQLYMESNYGKYRNSEAGARGLMQIMPVAVEEVNRVYGTNYTIEDMDDDEKNLDVYNKYMDYLYERPYLTKGNDSVVNAKILAAYNAGPGKIKKYLEKQKENGIDIYDSWDWVDGLDSEPRDYINFGLRNMDIEGTDKLNKLYEKRRESNKELDDKVRQSTRKKQQFGGKTNMYQDRTNSQRFDTTRFSTGSQKRNNFKCGGRTKADLGTVAMLSKSGLGLLNTLAQGIAGSYISDKTRKMYEGFNRVSTYVPTAREHIVYTDQSNAKRDAVRQATEANKRYIDINTGSSKVATNRRMINNLNQAQGLSEIENYEIGRRDQSRNAEAQLQTQYNLYDTQNKIADIKEANDFEAQRQIGLTNARTTAANTWAQAIASGLGTIGGAISDRVKYLYNLAGSRNADVANAAIKKLGLDVLDFQDSKKAVEAYNNEHPNSKIVLRPGYRMTQGNEIVGPFNRRYTIDEYINKYL